MGLRAFRHIPKNLVEWSQWFSAQTTIESNPPSGYHKVINIYWDADAAEIVVEYEDEAQT